VNKETLDEVSFGLDLVQLAAHLGSSQPSGASDVPAEVEQLKVALRKIAVEATSSEPQECRPVDSPAFAAAPTAAAGR
jgi:hypothetical protein